jgi:hypothetical protein
MNKIMKEVLYGMAYLQENQMVHGDLRPSLICVPLAPTQNFLLLDRLANPAPPDVVQRMNIENGGSLYTSPAIFKSVLKKKKQIRHNPFKSDMFSLGMIILEAGILESVQSVYNHDGKSIDEAALVELVEKFIDRYPDDYVLQEGLMIMLEFSEKLRQTPSRLLETLRELKENEIEEGRAEMSHIKYVNDPMMNKVQFTESGYKFRDAEQMMVSNFSRIYPNKSKISLMKSENIEGEEMERSLVGIVKSKQSKIMTPQKEVSEKKVEGESATESQRLKEKEILDSFMKNEQRAKRDVHQVDAEIQKLREEKNQKEMEKKEEIRTPLNVQMEKKEPFEELSPPKNSTLDLYNKIVAEEEMFQSFKKKSMEGEEMENVQQETTKMLGTKKQTMGQEEDPKKDKNMFDINDYLNYYGVKKPEKEKEEETQIEQEPKSKEEPEAKINTKKEEPLIEIKMEGNEVRMEKVEKTEVVENSPEEKVETQEANEEPKKDSVYDYFTTEKFEGLASSGDFESEGEPLEIIPEDPEKWEEFKNSYVDVVNFDNAPSVTLFKGEVEDLYDKLGQRVQMKYDARKEIRKKRKQKIESKKKQIEEHNQRELMKDIRETNVIKRTIVSQDESPKPESPQRKNVFLDDPGKVRPNEFEHSQDRINRELLSQVPAELGKVKPRDTSPDGNLNSNFTYGTKSKENNQVNSNQFKSEVVLDPVTNEVRLKSQKNQKVISMKEYKKIMMEKEVSSTQKTLTTGNKHLPETSRPVKLYSNNANKPTPLKKPGKYLKLVVDANGNKRYEMVSVGDSPMGSRKEFSPPEVSLNTPSPHTQKYTVHSHSNNIQQSPLLNNTQTRTYTHIQNKPSSYIDSHKQITSFNSKSVSHQNKTYPSQNTYQVYRGQQKVVHTQNPMSGSYGQPSPMGVRTETTPQYQTYTYTGQNRRFENAVQTNPPTQVTYQRSVSPVMDPKKVRKSSKKVTVYRNGVKVSEQMYYDE